MIQSYMYTEANFKEYRGLQEPSSIIKSADIFKRMLHTTEGREMKI